MNALNPPLPRREVERRARVGWILQTAMDLLGNEGMEGFSTPRLAGALGYTAGALYRYFPSRDALLGSLQACVVSAFFQLAEEGLSRLEEDPAFQKSPRDVQSLARLLALAQVYKESAHRFPAQFRLVSMMLGQQHAWLNQPDAARVKSAVDPSLDRILDLFANAEKSGVFTPGPAGARATGAWAAWHGVLAAGAMQYYRPELYDPPVVEKTVLDGLFLGWGAKSKTLAAAHKRLEHVLGQGPLLTEGVEHKIDWWRLITQAPIPAKGAVS